MKKIVLILIALFVLGAGAVLFLHSNLDSIVKAAIEKYGTEVAQATVRLDSVQLSVASGEGTINGLTVGNPKGFTSSKALSMETISVKFDTNSITSNGPVIIREVIIERPEVNFEAADTGNSNLQTIENNISTHPSAAAQNDTDKKGPGRKIIISNLYIRNGQIDISHPLLKQTLTAPLPTIHLTNIGKDSGGATASQVANQILGSITSTATRVASDNLSGTLKNSIGRNIGDIGGHINGLLGR